jgi:hypothetical protein
VGLRRLKRIKGNRDSPHIEIFLRLKFAKRINQNIERCFSVGEPATDAKGVGKPIEIRLDKAR